MVYNDESVKRCVYAYDAWIYQESRLRKMVWENPKDK